MLCWCFVLFCPISPLYHTRAVTIGLWRLVSSGWHYRDDQYNRKEQRHADYYLDSKLELLLLQDLLSYSHSHEILLLLDLLSYSYSHELLLLLDLLLYSHSHELLLLQDLDSNSHSHEQGKTTNLAVTYLGTGLRKVKSVWWRFMIQLSFNATGPVPSSRWPRLFALIEPHSSSPGQLSSICYICFAGKANRMRVVPNT